jgi:ribonuclease E
VAGTATADHAAIDDRTPDDLPDRPNEGVPTGEAAARATVPDKPKIGDTRPAPNPVASGEAGDPDAPAKKKRRRRRGGKGRGGAGNGNGNGNRPVQQVAGEAAEVDPEVLARRRGRERKGRPVGRYLMCVHVRPHATQIAVLEGRALIEHYVSKPADDATEIFGNIYLGRVQNVLPGMEAAFVDIGTPKNAVLYKGDVQYDPEDVEEKGDVRIEQVLKAGQNSVCQVT